MFGNVLGVEEPEITTVSIRPGVVDTEMQAVIRVEGKGSKKRTKEQRHENYNQCMSLLTD